MRGYAYLDADGALMYKPADYIEEDNPGFWMQNEGLIMMVWQFDTADFSSMHRMYSRFKTLKLSNQAVLEFSSTIDFDIKQLTEYANSLQSKP
jgi:hypothetical protein